MMGFLVVTGVAIPTLHHVLTSDPPPPLLRLGQLPEFSFAERGGGTISLERDLKGKVWVADFIFTHCPRNCPLMSQQMLNLQRALSTFPLEDRRRVRLVSFTVDPKRDTVEQLAVYAEHVRAAPDFWYFLTGEKSEILDLMEHGFRLMNPKLPGEIDHSSKFVLVDATGAIRGYYEGAPKAEDRRPAQAALLGDIRRLLHE